MDTELEDDEDDELSNWIGSSTLTFSYAQSTFHLICNAFPSVTIGLMSEIKSSGVI